MLSIGRAWFSQILKAEEAYLFSKNCFKTGRFASVGSQGSDAGLDGGRSLLGQEPGLVPGWTTPSFVQVGTADFWAVLAAISSIGGILGNCSSTTCKALRVPRDR